MALSRTLVVLSSFESFLCEPWGIGLEVPRAGRDPSPDVRVALRESAVQHGVRLPPLVQPHQRDLPAGLPQAREQVRFQGGRCVEVGQRRGGT